MNSNTLFTEMFDASPEDGRQSLPAMGLGELDKILSSIDAKNHIKANAEIKKIYIESFVRTVLGDTALQKE